MPRSNRRLGQWVAGFWIFNFLCAAVVAILWLVSVANVPAAPRITPIPTFAIPSSPTPTSGVIISSPVDPFVSPTPTPLPSATEQPTSTPEPTTAPTDTPLPPAATTAETTPTATLRPFFEGPIIIGHTVANRPLEVFRFGTGPIKRMIIAGIHGGGEWNTIALADQLIVYLHDNPQVVPAEITLYILRSLNPDGEARGHGPVGRVNERGVDLNRNWPWNWQRTWNRSGCWTLLPVTGGQYAGSEPEVSALLFFIEFQDIDALISYHSAALGIFAGGYDYQPSVSLSEAVAEVTNYPWPPIDTGCEMTGDLTDWAAGEHIAAIDIELTNHTNTDYEQNVDVLHVFLNWRR